MRAVSYMVASMMKMKSGNLVGIGNHNQRRFKKHSNEAIDVERSHLNYDLVNQDKPFNYKTDIEKFINEKKSTSRAVRKDAVLVNEWLITSDKAFFEGKDGKEIERFFTEAKNYFADKFGDDNVRYAHVHLDESTPHMHLGVVPFDKDNKLSAKRVFNRKTLIEIQEELPKHLNEQGFELERGEKGSKRSHLSVEDYKAYMDNKKALEAEIDDLKQDLVATEGQVAKRKQEVEKLTEGKPLKLNVKKLGVRPETKDVKVPTGEKILGIEKKEVKKQPTGNVVMPQKSFDTLVKNYTDLRNAYQKVENYLKTDLVEENKKLNGIIKEYKEMAYNADDVAYKLKQENESLQEENKTLKQQVQSLKGEIKTIYQTFSDYFVKGLKNNAERAKGLMKDFAQVIDRKLPDSEFKRVDDRENKPEQKRNRGMSR